jgi:CcmD family protein
MDQNYTFMFYGFTAAWLVVIIYVISIALRERKLRDELDRVKRMVEDREHEAKR